MIFPFIACVAAVVFSCLETIKAERGVWNLQRVSPRLYKSKSQRHRYQFLDNNGIQLQLGSRPRPYATFHGGNRYPQFGRTFVPYSSTATRRTYKNHAYTHGHFIPFKDWSKKGIPRNFVTKNRNNIKNTLHTSSTIQQGLSGRKMISEFQAPWQRAIYNKNPRLMQARAGNTRRMQSFWGASPAIKTKHMVSNTPKQSSGKKPVINKQALTGYRKTAIQVSVGSSKTSRVTSQMPYHPGNYLSYHATKPTIQGKDFEFTRSQARNSRITNPTAFGYGTSPSYLSLSKSVPSNGAANIQKANSFSSGSIKSRLPDGATHSNLHLLTSEVKPIVSTSVIHPQKVSTQPATGTSLIPPGPSNNSEVKKVNGTGSLQPSLKYKSSALVKTSIVNGQTKSSDPPLDSKKLMWTSMLFPPLAVARTKVNAPHNQDNQNVSGLTTSRLDQNLMPSDSQSFHNSNDINKIKLTQTTVALALNNSIRKDLEDGLTQPDQTTSQPRKELSNSQPAENPGNHDLRFSAVNQRWNVGTKGDASEKVVIPKKTTALPAYIQIRTNTSELALKNFLNNLAKFYVLKKSKSVLPKLNQTSNKMPVATQKSNIFPNSANNEKKSDFGKPNSSSQIPALSLSSKNTQGITILPQSQRKPLSAPTKLGLVSSSHGTPATLRVVLPNNKGLRTLGRPQSGNQTPAKTTFQVPVITIKPVVIKVMGNRLNTLSKAVSTDSFTKQPFSTNTVTNLPEKKLPNSSPLKAPHTDYGIMGNDSPPPLQVAQSTTRDHIPGAEVTRAFNGDGKGVFVRTAFSNSGRTPSDYRRSEIPHPAATNTQTPSRANSRFNLLSSKRNQALNTGASFGSIHSHSQLRKPMKYGNILHNTPQMLTATNRYNVAAKHLSYKPLTYSYKRPSNYIGGEIRRKQYVSTQRAAIPYRSSFPLMLRKVYPYFGKRSRPGTNVNDKPRERRRFLELRPRTRRRNLEIEEPSGRDKDTN